MKMLIVDDCDIIQLLLKNAIIKIDEHISISQAGCCREALELFNDFNPDTIILDIALPDGSGIDLLRRFKTINPGVSILMFTNYPHDEFKKRCHELGANYFFDKSNIKAMLNIIINKTLISRS